jgi:multisubunit Na+/H+ antiporter MnhC subunit
MTGIIIAVCIAAFVLLILMLSLNRGANHDATTHMRRRRR